ncbi:hypothetical protein K449DRAFT_113155 [Hypoxylon sp. EC38]|nr:hypothetical protein K449DRAFT_113155 [Hypoxylon sp. EC38]
MDLVLAYLHSNGRIDLGSYQQPFISLKACITCIVCLGASTWPLTTQLETESRTFLGNKDVLGLVVFTTLFLFSRLEVK